MKVCLAIMAKGSPDEVLAAIESARPFVDEVCLVVAPGDELLELELPIPGRIVEEPWRGHALTRTATLRHAESDPEVEWIVMIDADDTFAPGGRLPPHRDTDGADAYSIPIDSVFPGGRWRYWRSGHVIRARRGFFWDGAVHEAMRGPPGSRVDRWRGLVYRLTPPQGTRAGGRTYDDDAKLLAAELERDPTNTRAAFYYAQSLKDAGRPREAIEAFLRRASMGGWVEEAFWAKLWAAKLAVNLGMVTRIEELYLGAHALLPDRAEPLRDLACVYGRMGLHDEAERYDALADALPFPYDAGLFVDVMAYAPEVRP